MRILNLALATGPLLLLAGVLLLRDADTATSEPTPPQSWCTSAANCCTAFDHDLVTCR